MAAACALKRKVCRASSSCYVPRMGRGQAQGQSVTSTASRRTRSPRVHSRSELLDALSGQQEWPPKGKLYDREADALADISLRLKENPSTLLVDLSGSVVSDARMRRELYRFLRHVDEEARSGGASLEIFGYDGSSFDADIYELRPSGDPDGNALDTLFAGVVGGGGTPTEKILGEVLKNASDDARVVVLTDGMTFSPKEMLGTVKGARACGRHVAGVAFGAATEEPGLMDEQFGAGTWFEVKERADGSFYSAVAQALQSTEV